MDGWMDRWRWIGRAGGKEEGMKDNAGKHGGRMSNCVPITIISLF